MAAAIPSHDQAAWTIPTASNLALQTSLPTPTPGPKQALIRISAVSLNFRDHLVLHHSPAYPLQTSPNLVPCSDGAGTIAAAGAASAWRTRLGARVIIHSNTWLDGDVGDGYVFDAVMGAGAAGGTLARYVVLDDERVLEAPRGLGEAQAAGMMTAGLTAWAGLFEAPGGVGRPAKGVTVLTQGTGGVSCFAIQVGLFLLLLSSSLPLSLSPSLPRFWSRDVFSFSVLVKCRRADYNA